VSVLNGLDQTAPDDARLIPVVRGPFTHVFQGLARSTGRSIGSLHRAAISTAPIRLKQPCQFLRSLARGLDQLAFVAIDGVRRDQIFLIMSLEQGDGA